jgi:cellulose synthase/poly-beta-1,6-N-acetylglucosamine synthase-like glycosyltransferase
MLTDADAVLEKDAVQRVIDAFDDPEVGAVGGQPKPMNKRDNMFGFWAHYLFAMGHKIRAEQSKRGEFYYISGPILAIRKGIIKEMPKNAMATDAVLGFIIKNKDWKVVYVPDAIVYQKAPENLKDYFAQKRRTMAGFYQMKKWFKIRPVRTFTSEALGGFFEGIKFAKSPVELLWFLELCFYRVLAWVLAYYDLQIKKKSIEEIWTPIESTK